MKYLFLIVIFSFLFFTTTLAQERKHSTFYEQRASLFEVLPTDPQDIIFLGNSITNGCEWGELFQDIRIKNRGISGDITTGVYDRLDPILKGRPAKLFLLIGINDLAKGIPADTIAQNIRKILQKIRRDSPATKLYLQSVLPVNDCYGKFKDHTSKGKAAEYLNASLRLIAEENHATYIDLWSHFVDPVSGKMNPVYTNDGLHLLGKGYLLWREIILPYLQEK